MKRIRLLNAILKNAGAIPVIISLFSFLIIAAFLLLIVEPEVTTYGDSLWLCFTTVTTIGYGDFYAQTGIGRIISMILAFYGIITIALITGVAVSYFTEIRKIKSDADKMRLIKSLENLENLSKEELSEISRKIRERDLEI